MFRGFDNLHARPRSLVQSLFGGRSSFSFSNTTHLDIKSEENTTEWTWDVKIKNEFVEALNDDRDVTFHRNRSSGTAVVRGNQPMSHGQHFWEIKMLSPIYGTDVMVGVGTPEADMTQLTNTYISRLGKDSHTWGFSYTGSFHHNGEERFLSSAFGQGSIIGLHLDMWNGTLSLYKNYKCLGIASRGLKGKTLYAMASSTAACSRMRLLRSCSFPSSLQFLCCARLRDLIPEDKCVLNELDIPPGLKLFLKNNLSWLLSPRCVGIKFDKGGIVPEEDGTLKPITPSRRFVLLGRQGIPVLIRDHVRGRFVLGPVLNLQPSESDREPHIEPNLEPNEPNIETSEPNLDPSEPNHEPSEPNLEPSEEVDNDDELSEDQDESACKRRKYSYNYAVGLSDPDSESEI